MPAIWNFVTDFGDGAVTAPLALLALIFLIAAGQKRLAVGWALAIGGCVVAIAALKLIFGACGAQLTVAHIISPSGHTAISTSIYGSLALLAGARLTPRRRAAVNSATIIVILAIAVSRLALNDHSLPEIVVGLMVGMAGVMVFHAVLRRAEAPDLPLGWMLLCGGALIAAMHGVRWTIEPTVHRLAGDFRLALPWCR